VFNELLTGKATLEPAPQPQAPYREPGVLPPATHACATCRRSYQGPAGSIAGTCASCQLAVREINARNDALAFQQAEAAQQRVQNQHKLFVFIGSVVIIALALVFKVGMKTQLREDLAQGAGYKSYGDDDSVAPSDAYSQRIHSLASEMCACKDLACAREVQTAFVNYARSHGPSDDSSEASATADVAKLADCQHAIEAGPATP